EELERAHPRLVAVDDGDRHRADRLLRRAAARAGDAGDADADAGAGARANALGHRLRHRLADRAVLRDQRFRHARQLRLRAVAVAHHATLDVVRAAGDVGQPRHQQTAGARFRYRDRELAFAQQIADHRFERATVDAVDRRAERLLQLTDGAIECGVRDFARRGAGGEVQL